MNIDENKYSYVKIPDDAIVVCQNGQLGYYVKDDVDKITLIDIMVPYIGTQEYSGVIADCQTWFYGSLVKDSWCATWLSFCLNKMGLLTEVFGSKQENVYMSYQAMKKKVSEGTLDEINASTGILQIGDILVFNWSGKFSTVSSKHITVCSATIGNADLIPTLGGNQRDGINKATYDRKFLIGAFRPHYK